MPTPAFPLLPPFSWARVQPFVYREFMTGEILVEHLRKYIMDVVVPYIDENLGEFGQEITDRLNETLDNVKTALDNTLSEVDGKISASEVRTGLKLAELEAKVNAAVQQIINNAIEVSDPVIAGVLEDNQSLSAKRVYELSGEPTLRNNLLYPSVSCNIRPDRTLEEFYRPRVDLVASHGGGVTLCPYETIPDASSAVFTRVPDTLSNGLMDMFEDAGVPIYMIKPHIVTASGGDGFYRMNYLPDDLPTFWLNWRNEMLYWAGVCQTRGIPYLCITVEMGKLTHPSYAENWRGLISRIRQDYPEVKLTAAYTTAELWQQWESPGWIKSGVTHMAQYLDAYGINSWITLTKKIYDPANPDAITNDEMVRAYWLTAQNDAHQQRLINICSALNIPYWVTEIGCRPYYNALANQAGGGTYDPEDYDHEHAVQAILYKSIFDGIANSDYCVGISIWHLDSPFNYADLGATVNTDTKAVDVLKLYFSQIGAITA